MSGATKGIDRRLLLTLGAATLVSACSSHVSAQQSSSGSSGATTADTTADTTAQPGSSLSSSPSCRPPSKAELNHTAPLDHLPCNGADIALTIDDGPHQLWTPQVLELLDHLAIPATFCVVGQQAKKLPRLVADVVAAGHQLANHTYTHAALRQAKAGTVAVEIERAQDAILTATAGRGTPTLFRAPGGGWSPTVLGEVAARGMRPLGWSLDPRDWSRPGVPAIVAAITTGVRPGSIILEHDGGGDRSQTVAALTEVLPRLLDQGYRFVLP